MLIFNSKAVVERRGFRPKFSMKACPEAWMKQEAHFLAALKGVQQYGITKEGKLQLVYRLPEGFGILTFVSENLKK